MRAKRLARRIVWCYRRIYRPYGYGRLRSAKCAVLVNVMPAVVRWKERRTRDGVGR